MPVNPSDRNDEIERALARYSAVDGLLLRPQLASINAALDIADKTVTRRIALLAHQELEQLIRHSPADPIPYMQLAKIYLGQQRWKDTIRVLDAGVQHNPEYEPLLQLREDLILQSARQAVEAATQTFAKEPTAEGKLHLERCQTNLANESIAYCRSRLDRHPEQTELLIAWAGSLTELGRAVEAMPLLKRAVSDPSLRAQATYQLGLGHEQLDQPLEALAAYRTAALFRAPPPDARLRCEALVRAFELSDRLGLVDAAKRYAQLLVETEGPHVEKISKRFEILRQTPL